MFTFRLVSDVRRRLLRTHWSRKLCQGLHPGQDWHTDSDRQAGHVVHDYHLVTSNSDWENLKHPEAAADGQLACRAALTTYEGVPRGVTLYPASLGATMTRIHQVTSVNYI